MSKHIPPTISINMALIRPRVGQGIWCICISPMVSFQLLAFPSAETMNDIATRLRPTKNKACVFTLPPHRDIQVRLLRVFRHQCETSELCSWIELRSTDAVLCLSDRYCDFLQVR